MFFSKRKETEMELQEKKQPLSFGGFWNMEMAQVREMAKSFRRHLGFKPDFVAGFEFAVSLLDEKFWQAKALYEKQEAGE